MIGGIEHLSIRPILCLGTQPCFKYHDPDEIYTIYS